MNFSESHDDLRPTDKMSTSELLRYKDQLTALKSSLESAVAASQQKITEDDKNSMDTRIVELQEELLKETSLKSARSLALQRLQMGGALLKILFDEDSLISQEERNHITSQLDRQKELTAEILAHGKHCDDLRQEQGGIQAERRELTQQNRVLMSELKAIQQRLEADQKDNGSNAELREDVETMEGNLSILQNVLQGLIIGSGVNWAKDPALTKLLLSLGDKIP